LAKGLLPALLALGGFGLLGTPRPAVAATGRLDCPGGPALALATGTEAGDCLVEKGLRALCADGASNAAYARCDRGCLFTNGTGSCSLADEEPVPATLVLVCEGGARYLLRTRTGRGACTTTEEGSGRSARCADGKTHQTSADCKDGCGAPRGQALCAKYKAETAAPAKP
jgi:hypothetical protein